MSNKNLIKAFKSKLINHIDDIHTVTGNGLYEYANAVCETAKKMAPRDTGELEENLSVSVEIDGDTATFTVSTDPVDEDGNHYGEEASKNITPAGDWKLGLDSVKKQSVVDVVVGGEFIERAILETKFDLLEYVKSHIK